jgi:hypothetical protein
LHKLWTVWHERKRADSKALEKEMEMEGEEEKVQEGDGKVEEGNERVEGDEKKVEVKA